MKHLLLICCLFCSTLRAEQLTEDAIEIADSPSPDNAPVVSEMEPQPRIQSRSGYNNGYEEGHGHASYHGGHYDKGDSGYGAGGYNQGYYFDPKRTGYHIGLGLGALKGMLIGKGSEALSYRSDYENGGYGGYKSYEPSLNIYDGLLLLKGIIKGTRESQVDGFHLGKKLAPIQRAFLSKAKAVQGLFSSFGGGGYGGGGYGGGGHGGNGGQYY